MTYLEAVNRVLIKLREDEVTTVVEDSYSKLIGIFVNDAYEIIADSWDWTGFRASIEITTVPNQSTYSLTGFTPRSKILYVNNETQNVEVYQESLQRTRYLALGTNNASGTVSRFSLANQDANGDLQIRFSQTPSAAEVFTVYGVRRPGNLTADSEVLALSSLAVVQWAFAFALRERGETGGQNAMEQFVYAKDAVDSAIALDANQHPEELIWTVV